MNNESIITELRLYNRWRRGDEAITAPDPTALGKLLDAAADSLAELVRVTAERDAAQEEARQWAESVGTLQRQLEVANAELAAKEKELGSFRTLVCKMTPENIVRTRLAIGYGMSATRCLEVQR